MNLSRYYILHATVLIFEQMREVKRMCVVVLRISFATSRMPKIRPSLRTAPKMVHYFVKPLARSFRYARRVLPRTAPFLAAAHQHIMAG